MLGQRLERKKCDQADRDPAGVEPLQDLGAFLPEVSKFKIRN
jgi:hypothetical protein